MTATSIKRTRQSIGSQLRETLDAMKEKGQIRDWGIDAMPNGRNAYRIVDGYGREDNLHVGILMDWVNSYGYDVRFGKS